MHIYVQKSYSALPDYFDGKAPPVKNQLNQTQYASPRKILEYEMLIIHTP